MSARRRDWLKFIGLVGLAFVFGLAFASALDLPKKTSAEPAVTLQAAPPPVIPAAKPAAELGDAFVAVAEHVKPAVVFVRSEIRQRADSRLPPGFQDFFPNFKNQPQIEEGSGSGFIVSPDGYILTNNHVVAGASKVTVRLYDKREFDAHVVGTDPQTDVAVIKIPATDLPTVAFGNSDSTRIGEWVLAIGNPLGEAFAFTVTAGIVSAKGRLLNGLQESRYSIQDFIQTDAAINPGNSGGPLVNIRGEVIGINSAIASGTGYYAGYGFAIPINLARTVMTQLVATGHVERAVMGVSIKDATQEDADAVGLKEIRGVVVEGYASDNSPAKRAGIELGDVIVSLDGQPVDYTAQLQQRVGFKKPGEAVQVTVLRPGGVRKTYAVRLAAQPTDNAEQVASNTSNGGSGNDSATANRLGIGVEPLTSADVAQTRDAKLQRAQQRGALVVTDVSTDGPAYRKLAGSNMGGSPDVILAVNGSPMRKLDDFRSAMAGVHKGDIVTLTVLRRTPDGWDTAIVRIRAD
jgi:serine protease Do